MMSMKRRPWLADDVIPRAPPKGSVVLRQHPSKTHLG